MNNLYLVECCCKHGSCRIESLEVYVTASDEKDASDKALNKMRNLKWRFDDYIGCIKLIASTDEDKSSSLLIIY